MQRSSNILIHFKKGSAGFYLVILGVLALLLYIGDGGIPFLEGDRVITSGKAYDFRIGMTRSEAFKSIVNNYSKDGYYLRVLWPKNSTLASKLEIFENTEWRNYGARNYSEHQVLIENAKEITLPLSHSRRWDIRMPGGWVNTIHLEFEGERLIRVQRSKWLFERP